MHLYHSAHMDCACTADEGDTPPAGEHAISQQITMRSTYGAAWLVLLLAYAQLQASACLSAPVMLMAACLEAAIVFWASQELVTSGKWTAAGLRVACVATLVLPRLLLDGNLRRSKVWLTRVQKPHMD